VPPAVDADRAVEVAQRAPAEELEAVIELALDLIERAARDQEAAGFGQRFQAGGDVDAVAQEVVAVDHDVAEVDADPEFDPVGTGPPGVDLRDLFLDLERRADRPDGARELRDRAVAGAAEHPALVLRDHFVDQGPAGAQRRQRRLFVARHQPAEADHVGRQDRGDPALDLRLSHDQQVHGATRERSVARFLLRTQCQHMEIGPWCTSPGRC
jgi:hypothetical protein